MKKVIALLPLLAALGLGSACEMKPTCDKRHGTVNCSSHGDAVKKATEMAKYARSGGLDIIGACLSPSVDNDGWWTLYLTGLDCSDDGGTFVSL